MLGREPRERRQEQSTERFSVGVPSVAFSDRKRAYSLLAKRSTANDWLDYTYTAIPIDRQNGIT